MSSLRLGSLNGHTISIVMREAIRRAMQAIDSHRFVAEATEKTAYDGISTDVFTQADVEAQQIIVRMLRECFPNFGIIGEEGGLNDFNPKRPFFTVDPLDGTRALLRNQSHGIGSMISLCFGSNVLSAYIGDVNTGEIFGYRMGSQKVWRITRAGVARRLHHHVTDQLKHGYALLRDPLSSYPGLTQSTVLSSTRSQIVDGGSIGTWLARLWKREVAMAVLSADTHETPWDSNPIYGISRQLGYRLLRPDDRGGWEEYRPPVFTHVEERDHEVLIVHGDHFSQLSQLVV